MKKLWVNIGIFFGCFLLLISCLGAVLVFAPGMELLGVMYIRSTSGTIKDQDYVANAINFETIEINTDNIPVYIDFVQSYTCTVKMVEEYDGFAKAGDAPYVKTEKSTEKIVITSYEYKPILFNSRSDESGLFVQIPQYYTNNIVINSKKSSVKFGGNVANVKDISISATGDITLANNINMNSLKLNYGNKPVVISDGVNMNGTVYATSKGGDLTLPAGFTGKVEFTSTTGDLKCAGCGQLSFSSKTGQVKGVGDKLPNIVGDCVINTGGSVVLGSVGGSLAVNSNNGSVTLGEEGKIYTNRIAITTKAGKVTMNGIYTNSENSISTKYGKININESNKIAISSKYGDVDIKRLISGVIKTTSGDITIGNISGDAIIETNRGDVVIGSNEAKTGGANITTKSGSVEIINAGSGEFIIKTKSGDVEFAQNQEGVSKLTIESEKGDVSLDKITGETSVKTSGEITAFIYNITNPITLVGKNKDVNVVVRQYCYCDINSKKNIVEAPGLEIETKQYNSVPDGVNQYLKIETAKGEVSVIVK